MSAQRPRAAMKMTAGADGVIIDLLQQGFPAASKTTLRDMLRHGRVALDGEIVKRADNRVRAGQVVEIAPRHASLPADARQGMPSPGRPRSATDAGGSESARPPGLILFRDKHVLAIEKPPGLLSVARDASGADTFYRRLNRYVQETSAGKERIYIVHRLDREASGVMLFALSLEVQDRLQRNWAATEKRYWALVEGRPPEAEGTIRNWLRENRVHKMYSGRPGEGAKQAVTHYWVRRSTQTRSLLEVEIETGRKNQIRAHLSELGCPVVGDEKYGARTNPLRRLGLHAWLLVFNHPVTGKEVRLELPLPRAFRVRLGGSK